MTVVQNLLTESSAVALMIKLGFFSNGSKLTCRELDNDNQNLIFHVYDQAQNKGLIIKQSIRDAKQYAKIENSALLRQSIYVPHLVPKVVYADTDLAVTVLEDLSHLQIVKKGLMNGNDYPNLSTDIGEFLGKTLFYSSSYALDIQVKKRLMKHFTYPKFWEANFFNRIPKIDNNQTLKVNIDKLKKRLFNSEETLIHGNLHTGSIWAGETETKVTDPKFSFFGPIGFDLGQFIASLFFTALTRNENQQIVLYNHIETMWETFCSSFSEAWEKDCLNVYKTNNCLETILREIFADTVGFAGCELMRLADRSFKQKERALKIGAKFTEYPKYFHTTKDMIHTVQKE
ncbi:S-methyl-5-thioribose kinase [Bacillus sp. CLL-7-23]|uniref:S-methyl-5-thioribose kinase n=1 Tax=Bacillus changyiensis TaxID=3004103 RepID=A0ABT4X1Q6_9BACI|nr:S-methyl-5-thioribose kinase [Bacillus changyiensis]MDA7026214.1 S-methyl-5-thioribose kinase [Bacillus changyiensis]